MNKSLLSTGTKYYLYLRENGRIVSKGWVKDIHGFIELYSVMDLDYVVDTNRTKYVKCDAPQWSLTYDFRHPEAYLLGFHWNETTNSFDDVYWQKVYEEIGG